MISTERRFVSSTAPAPEAATTATLPPIEVIALNRMGYGLRASDLQHVQALGFEAYVAEQLNPDAIDDSACDQVLGNARLKIRYNAVNEARPLTALGKSIAELWPLANYNNSTPYAERMRPFEEVRLATWVRAVQSKRQLKELLVEFWHNHFNVNASSDAAIAATLPVYDRDVIRANCLGNFRTMLEAVGKSVAMMYALDNVSNKAGGGEGGNENYARELFELHTLGSDNYLKFYDDRSGVGTIEYGGKTYVRGYIDIDVYESARCFTGWTIANGNWQLPEGTPNNGTFFYAENWHDTAQKVVLSADGRPTMPYNQAALKDGQDVYDRLAAHPGTARHLCTKLCRRLIADEPADEVVNAAVAEWMAAINAADQIKRVVRVILLSSAFRSTWGQKVKRPFEALVSYLRATNATLPVDYVDAADSSKGNYWGSLVYNVANTGQRLYEWPTPTGHPDTAEYWTSTNSNLRRWNLPYVVTQSWGGNVQIDLVGQSNLAGATCTQIVDTWIARLIGYQISESSRQPLITFMAQGGDANQPPKPTAKAPDWGKQDALKDRLQAMVLLLAMTPEFQLR